MCTWQEHTALTLAVQHHHVFVHCRYRCSHHAADINANINMQYRKSLGSFLRPNTGKVPVSQRRRRGARSPLDTFVIPGRTRVPSAKPKPIDVEVAQNLLRRNMSRTTSERSLSPVDDHAHIGQSPSPVDDKASDRAQTPDSPCSNHPVLPLTSNEPPLFLQPIHYKPLPDPPSTASPPPRVRRHKAVAHGRPRRKTVQQSRRPRQVTTPPSEEDRTGYDGTLGSSFESTVTSIEWTSIGHRGSIMDSSSSSQDVPFFGDLDEYNQLARRNGIPEMKNESGGKSAKNKISNHGDTHRAHSASSKYPV